MVQKAVDCDIDLVAELIDSSSRTWIPQVLSTLFPQAIVEKFFVSL